MALTVGAGPFSPQPAGVFNGTWHGPERTLYLEDSPRRVRGVFAKETVVDSRRVKLLYETGLHPVWYFPLEDLRTDLLEPTDRTTHCPFKGAARYWSLRVGDRVAENAVWSYPEPVEGAPPIKDLAAMYWRALDAWFEEDEAVLGHPRDPYHRVDVLRSSRHVVVSVDGEVLAECHRPALLFETGLPARYYLPPEDVRLDRLEASLTRTVCPYKGTARYWSVRGSAAGRDLAWAYDEPLPAVAPIAGRLCFYDERVDVDVDGERQPRPQTAWPR
jgi:uncharacterized protein (DUF427 family)